MCLEALHARFLPKCPNMVLRTLQEHCACRGQPEGVDVELPAACSVMQAASQQVGSAGLSVSSVFPVFLAFKC